MTESGPEVPPSRPDDGGTAPAFPGVAGFLLAPLADQVPAGRPFEPGEDGVGAAVAAYDAALDEMTEAAGEARDEDEDDDSWEEDAEDDAPVDEDDLDEDEDEAVDEDDEDFEEEPDPRRVRFNELVEERLARARYSHPMARVVMTPEELVLGAMVERRAAVWVPASTFCATVVSAVSAVVLAAKLHSDPSNVSSSQVLVVLITVILLAASFVVLLRSEVHFERIRPKGRLVRADVADAYETVRDAPRRLLDVHAEHEVLVRVAGLLPAAERLVDSLVEYSTMGGVKIKAHPAYDRLLRMRAEIEAIEIMLEEAEGGAERVLPEFAALPRPEQVTEYESLSDIAAFIDGYGIDVDDPLQRLRQNDGR